MLVLLDAIGTLAECLGPRIDNSLFYEKLFDPLIQLWISSNKQNDPVHIAAFECLSCTTLAIPKGKIFLA